MSFKNVSNKQKQEERICDICGGPHVRLRVFEDRECGIIDWLSGFTCQKCLDADKEHDYVKKMWDTKVTENIEYNTLVGELEKLDIRTNGNPDAEDVENITRRLEELDKNQEVRDQLAERFQRIRLNNKASFIGEYGLGVEHEKCETCGLGFSYLCVMEDHFDNNIEILDQIAGWFCSNCIITGIWDTQTSKALRELMLFRKEWQDVIEKYEFFESIADKSQFTEEEIKSYVSTFEHRKRLEVQEAVYNRKAERMEKARLAYEGTPVKTIIKSAKEGDPCILCGKTYGEGCKCEDDYKVL